MEVRDLGTLKRDVVNWSYFNNTPNLKKYDYIHKRGKAMLPIYSVHIPCQVPICDILISQQTKRAFQFTTRTIDQNSLNSKFNERLDAYLKRERDNREMLFKQYSEYRKQIEQQMQQLQQMLQAKPQTEEEAAYIQQLQQSMPEIQRQFQMMLEEITKMETFTAEEKEEIDYYYSFSYRDVREVISQRMMSKVRTEYNTAKKSVKSIKNTIVTGKPMYLCFYNEETGKVEYDVLNSLNVKFPKIQGIEYIQDCPWVSVKDTISEIDYRERYKSIIEKEYGVILPKDRLEEGNMELGRQVFVSTPGHGAIYMNGLNNDDTLRYEEGITRERIWFVDIDEYNFTITKNTKEDALVKRFIHQVPINKIPLDKNKYKYKKITIDDKTEEYYINKTDENDIYLASQVMTYDSEKTEVIKRYLRNRYSAEVINNKWIVNIKKDLHINRSVDKLSRFNLPVFGYSFSDISDQPRSIIGNTKDLQDLYNAIYMLRQLAYAIAGAKGNVIDKSQKPSCMENDEWEANMAQGRLYIETVNKNGGRINPSYNQWQSFDNSVSASVQYYDNVLEQIRITMGNIVGVPPQRLAQINKEDLVGNTEIAIEQSFLMTEILYQTQDDIEARALNELLMLKLKYGKIDNSFIQFDDRTEGSKVFKIEDNMFKDCDIELIVENSPDEQRNLMYMKEILKQEYAKQTIDAEGLSELLDIRSVKEMQMKTRYLIDKSRKLMQQQQSSYVEQNKKANMEIEQFKADLKKAGDEHKNYIDEQHLQIASFIAQSNAQLEAQRLQLEAMKAQDNKEIENKKIDSEERVEKEYLAEQAKSTQIDQQLNALKNKYDTLISLLQIKSNASISSLDRYDKSRMNRKTKEHISDR